MTVDLVLSVWIGVGLFLFCFFVYRVISQYEAREKVYLKMIRSLENRIAAKDLAGFMALEDEDRRVENLKAAGNFARDDEAEAKIAMAQMRAQED